MGRISYLLDTHTLLWIFYRKDLLPVHIVNIIEKEIIFVSSISFWEISIKFSKGTLDLFGKKPEDLIGYCMNEFNFQVLDLDIKTSASFYKLSANHHRDPFDRMLIWQAVTHDLIFLTNDANIQKYQDIGLKFLW